MITIQLGRAPLGRRLADFPAIYRRTRAKGFSLVFAARVAWVVAGIAFGKPKKAKRT